MRDKSILIVKPGESEIKARLEAAKSDPRVLRGSHVITIGGEIIPRLAAVHLLRRGKTDKGIEVAINSDDQVYEVKTHASGAETLIRGGARKMTKAERKAAKKARRKK